MGFDVGTASSCCSYHPKLQVRCVVHGDDFTFSGNNEALDEIQRQMETAFLCKIEGRLGGDPQDLKQVRILNRVVSWESWGI